jgi:K+-transporting ATPase ATPase A chain
LNANSNFYNLSLGISMLIARTAILVPSIALGGLLARKKITPPSLGTFSTNTALFAILLMSVILIVGALSFFPALSLGPIVEHLLMLENRSF